MREIIVAVAAVLLAASPAWATNMLKHNSAHGCEQLVTMVHPDAKGKARGGEIHKCKSDPDGYSKANGY